MIHGSDLRDLVTKLNEGLLRAVQVAQHTPERELYDLVMLPGNQIEVRLKDASIALVGELTQVTDAGLCVAFYDKAVHSESLLRLVPYSSILCVIELPPQSENDDDE